MENKLVTVIYDRRKLSAKKGMGYIEVRVNLGHKVRKYITVGYASPDKWEKEAKSEDTLLIIKKCEDILTTMAVLGEESNMDNFNYHYSGEKAKPKSEEIVEAIAEPIVEPVAEVRVEPKVVAPQTADCSKKNFITYMEFALENEDLREGTRKHKVCAIEAVRSFGQIVTYGDLTPKKILAFDKWLHDGTRSDVTCYGYHKKIHKWVRQLHQMGEIDKDPYELVTLKRGKCKEREPLTETELKLMRSYKFEGKLDRVRDLFIFAAYTGLAFCDTQAFDFESMTKKEGKMYYIDGSRIKTDTKFFTPILAPAMKVLEKYDYQLPKISNQKANDYLHVIQMELHISQKLTFHVARHSFATMALAHDVPIENVARMLGHQDIKTTQIYAKVLRSTIERHATALQKSII